MGDLGVFEAMANAGKLSAEAEAKQGFELEKSVDRAIFRAKERFGAYLANSQSKSDFDERWSEVKPRVIKTIAEVTTPTPGVIRRVGAALRPSLPAPASTKKTRPSSAKTAAPKKAMPVPDPNLGIVPSNGITPAIGNSSPVRGDGAMPGMEQPFMAPGAADAAQQQLFRSAAVQKIAWFYDQHAKLWTSKDPMKKFACPGCGTEQEHLGFSHCAGCDRTWNSWPVRQAGGAKTGASTYVLMAREIKMRGDQFKLAGLETPKAPEPEPIEKTADVPPSMSQPSFGTMPGDNSAAMGSPMPAEQPPTPPAAPPGDSDHDGDVAGGITEDSPIDQIQDALEDAVMALKGVQMLSINPALAATASSKMAKVAALRTAMNRFWALHKQMNYVAGMLAKEANEAIKAADPRITAEAEFVAGFNAAAQNAPLPAKTGRAWLEGYVAFHTQADAYSDGAGYGRIFEPGGQDESTGARNEGTYLTGDGLDDGRANTSDAGPFDTSQPAQREFASQTDADNAAGKSRGDQGESSSIQPTGARRILPKGRR